MCNLSAVAAVAFNISPAVNTIGAESNSEVPLAGMITIYARNHAATS
jgi:hypothetical protein